MINKHLIIRFVRHWHARIGVLAAIFFLFLALTGLALNHTEALSLVKTKVSNPVLMHWYGLKANMPQTGFKTVYGIVASSDGMLVLDTQQLPISDPSSIQGAITWQDMLVIASQHKLYLVSPKGQLVDTLNKEALPDQNINNVGVYGEFLVLVTPTGIYQSEDAISWEAASEKNVVWSKPMRLDQTYQEKLSQRFQPSLPLERVMLDIHSGRILGSYGPILMDVVAIVLSVLSLSGVWIYLRSVRRNKKQH
jgi:uncharacterized iron-regulated membrane protein